MIKVYLAHAMTGRSGSELLDESTQSLEYLNKHNIEVLDPVIVENITRRVKKLNASYDVMTDYWYRDKEMIRKSNVLIDLTPLSKSEGVSHEIGYARYFLWKPVVRVFPIDYVLSTGSVAYFEDDIIAYGLPDAVIKIKGIWGTWFKRFIWRLKLYNRCLPKAILYKLKEWF